MNSQQNSGTATLERNQKSEPKVVSLLQKKGKKVDLQTVEGNQTILSLPLLTIRLACPKYLEDLDYKVAQYNFFTETVFHGCGTRQKGKVTRFLEKQETGGGDALWYLPLGFLEQIHVSYNSITKELFLDFHVPDNRPFDWSLEKRRVRKFFLEYTPFRG